MNLKKNQIAAEPSFNLTGILKGQRTTSFDGKSNRKSQGDESTETETLNEDQSRSSYVRRVTFSHDVEFKAMQ